jgi:uncharacterized protein YccT (UPF0319 family)
MSSFSLAATLIGEHGVEIVAIDGEEVESGFFGSEDSQLSDGNHQIVVKYAKNFRKDERVESRPYIFDLNIKGDTKISVDNINSQNQAERAIRDGLVWIVKNDGPIQTIEDSAQLTDDGYFPYRNIKKLITAYNQENDITLTSVTTTRQAEEIKATGQPKKHKMKTMGEQSKTQQLVETYKAATKSERKAFRIWLLEQDMK